MSGKRVSATAALAGLCLCLVAAGMRQWVGGADSRQSVEPTGPAEVASAGALRASGFIEADQVAVSSELGGRVISIHVGQGDQVVEGQTLVQLDDRMLRAQAEVAQAALELATVRLEAAVAGVRPERIHRAEADVALAQAARDGTYLALLAAMALRDNQQELGAEIAWAESQAVAGEHRLVEAVALKDAAEIASREFHSQVERLQNAKDKLEHIPEQFRPKLPGIQLESHLLPNEYWKSWVGVNSAQASLDGVRDSLEKLCAVRDEAQGLSAQIDNLRAQHLALQARADAAQGQLDALSSGATKEQLAVLEAGVEQAESSAAVLSRMHEKQEITAPLAGLVQEVAIHEGELAAPGATLLVIGGPGQVTLTVYVPENRLGAIALGQRVDVSVDGTPAQTFAGSVTGIGHEAEFTPRNVQTADERVNLVFAVDISIANPEGRLKPGVPADAVIWLD
jgi:HlyD family secretion protein